MTYSENDQQEFNEQQALELSTYADCKRKNLQNLFLSTLGHFNWAAQTDFGDNSWKKNFKNFYDEKFNFKGFLRILLLF